MTLPLEGVTVVSLEQAVAAPLATRHLADLGARVIKIEHPGSGDLARGYDHVVHGTGAHFVWLNRGKESLAVDVKSSAGREAVQRLIATADVFIQNLSPGAAARLGLGADELRTKRPDMIVAGISGYGIGGPLQDRKAYDLLIQAEAGLIAITGTPETAVKTGIPTADIASGMYLAQAVLAALVRKGRTGEGATIEVSMLEATVEWMGYSLYTHMHTGTQPKRMGLSHPSIAPYDSFPTSDGEMLIGVQNDSGWRTLISEVLEAPELADDPRYATNVARVQNRTECDREVSSRTRTWTSAQLADRLAAAGVPAAQVNEMAQVASHPQLAARDRWRKIHTENAEILALLPPATFADHEAPMLDVPGLGSNTVSILKEIGIDDDVIAAMITSGAAAQGS